jgi:multiple sugar transport system permease protein
MPVGRKELLGWSFLLPSLLLLLIVILIPFARGVSISFTNINSLKMEDYRFVGLANYLRLVKDPKFPLYLRNAFFYTAGNLAGTLVVGTVLAVILNRKIKFRSFYRAIVIIPWVMPILTACVVWRWIYDGQWGVFNYVMQHLRLIGTYRVWLGDVKLVWPSLLGMSIWKSYPFVYVVVLASLQVIPLEMYESAQIDGCGGVKQFWRITLPQIRLNLAFIAVLEAIWFINEFTIIFIMTSGGPMDHTMTFSPLVYFTTFLYFHIGYGSAIGVFVAVIMMILTFFYVRIIQRSD